MTRSNEIRQFVLENVSEHPQDITAYASKIFGVSRQAVHRHVRSLVDGGLLVATGRTRDRQYRLQPIFEGEWIFPISPNLKEDLIWRENLRPQLTNISPNVLNICQYGFTEMVNNAVTHSDGDTLIINLKYTADNIVMVVIDNGVGIFDKIQSELRLDDKRHAILELAKGKLTTDPESHTGEGIFFTSRAFDIFSILSGALFFAHNNEGDDWLLEDEETQKQEGTIIKLQIHPRSNRTLSTVFDRYTSEKDDFGFTRTIVPVALAKYGDENLLSRSQAKRLLARFDKFKEILLDFRNVEVIGQAFADEIFRVFQKQYPYIRLRRVGTNESVEKMIKRALSE